MNMKKNLFIWVLMLFIAGTITAQNTKTNTQSIGEKGKLLVFEGSELIGNQIIETGKYIEPETYVPYQKGYDTRSPKVVLLDPTGDGGFENGSTFPLNGWVVVNGTTNMWYVGPTAVPSNGVNSAFTGSSDATWAGTANANVNHFYRDVTIPAGQTILSIGFKYKIASVDATYDYLRIFIVPTSTTPVAGTLLASGQLGGNFESATAWTQATLGTAVTPGETYRIVFSWRTDGFSPHAAVAVDEIEFNTLASFPTATASALGGLWSSPASWADGIVPTWGDIVIPVGSTLVINQSLAYNDITVNGKLQWLTTTTPSTTVNTLQANNITINSGGSLLAHGAITAGSTVRVSGNFINNGTANFGATFALLQFNGTGGTQTLGGSGTFIADTEGRGMIRQLIFTTLAACDISTTQNIVTGNLALTAGSLNTNGKLHIDNTAISFGGLINRSVYSVVVNNMGSGYTSAPAVAFTAAPAGGTTATGVANLDAATGTIRSITITNPGNGYRVAPTITFSGGGGTGAAAVAIMYQNLSVSATSIAQSQKSAEAIITGGITINNNQGVGSIFVTNGGTGYTSAPTVGFALPVSFTNLITNGGSGYTSAPTVTFSGGGATTQATATAVVSRGQVVSVHITAGGTNYTSAPTISITGGGGTGATASIPAGMLPTATAIIDPALGMITGFNVTNPGYGYLLTVPGVTLTGGGGTGAVGATSRHGVYNLIYNWFGPAVTNPVHAESAVIPANRRIHAFTIANAEGANFNNNLTLYALAPLPTSTFMGNINMGGNILTFEHPSYTGYAGTAYNFVSNGSITYKLLGSTASQTRPFPFNTYDGAVNNLVTMGASTTVATTGSTITSITGNIAGAPSGVNMIGTRTLRVQTNGQWGNNPTVRLTWNSVDNLVAEAPGLTIAQAVAPSGPWTIRSIASGTGNINPAGGNRTTATTVPGPIVPTGDDYFGWNFGVACPMPTGLNITNYNLTSVTINWNAPTIPPAGGYQWEVRTSGEGGSGATGLIANGSTGAGVTTAGVTGLSAATTYSLYVRSVCSGTEFSNWAGPQVFSTPVVLPSPHSQGFATTSVPSGWSTTGWTIGSTRGATGNPGTNIYKNFWNATGANSGSFTTVNVGPITAGSFLSFDYKASNYDSPFAPPAAGSGNFVVEVSANFGNSYAILETIVLDGGVGYRKKIYDLASFVGQTIHVRITGNLLVLTADYDLSFDNFAFAPTCSVPGAQPTNLTLMPASTSINGSYTAATGATGHLVLLSTSPTLVTLPQNNTNYSTGNAIGTATVVYAGTNTTTFNTTGLNAFTQYYFFVFAYNAGESCTGPVYRTVSPLTGSATTLPAAPVSLTATPQSTSQISLTGVANTFNHNVLVAWNTTNDFGTPTGIIGFGSQIPGGGTVHYLGSATEIPSHNNLNPGTQYFYRAWSFVDGAERTYSSMAANATATTFFGVPYLQDFNASTTLPSGWGGTGSVFSVVSNHGTDGSNGLSRNLWSSAPTANISSPTIVIPSGSPCRLVFDYRIVNYVYSGFPNEATTLGANDKIEVKYSTDNGSTYNVLYTINQANHATSTSFANMLINLSDLAGPIKFQFLATWGAGDYYVDIDNFKVEIIPTEPVFFVNPTEKNFGTVSIFAPPVPQVFTIRNNGVGVLEISSILLGGPNPDQFALVDNNDYPIELAAGEQTTVQVNFAPNSDGPKTGFLVINDNLSAKGQNAIPLLGVGVDPTITSFPWLESFEDPNFLPPTGWINNLWRILPGNPPFNWGGPRTGTKWAYSNTNGSTLTTPPIQLPDDGLTYTFSAYYRAESSSLNNAQDFDVLLSTDGINFDVVVFEGRGITSIAYQNISFDLDEYAGETIFIRFDGLTGAGGSAFGICIDDVSVFSPLAHTFVASNLSCFESNDGSISVTIQGGTPPYTITWYGPGFDPDGTTTDNPVATGLAAGVYEYTVKDAAQSQLGSVEITLTQPAAVPVPTTNNLTVLYDGLAKTLTAVAPAGTSLRWYNVAEGGTAIVSPTATEAGIYNFWVSALNAQLGCESVRVPATLTIQKKNLTVIADNQNKCQNTPLPELTISYAGFVAGEGIANLSSLPMASTTALPNSPVGTYPINVSGGTSNNYSFTYQNGTLTIIRTPIISAGDPGFVCVSESFPIVGATASNFGTLLWTSSGNGVFSNSGILNPVYTPGSQDVTNGNVTLTLTGDPGSFCSVADEVLLTIQNDLPVSVSITQEDDEICVDETVVFNAFPVNGGLTPAYQWKVNGVNAGSNNPVFTYVPTNGDVVTVVLTTSISCAINNTAVSNAITLTVIPDLTAEVFITTPSEAVCDFTPTTFTAVGTNGGKNPTYQWMVNGVNVGTDNTVFTYVPLNGDVVKVMMTSSHSCAVVPVANSNTITMSVAPPLLVLIANPENGGTVSGGGYYADGTVVNILAVPEIGWEFLNWKNGNGIVISTDSATTFTITNCYEQLTATFSSRAKIAGQLKYFNEQETLIPSPNENGVFYVQLFHEGAAFSERQLVKHSLEEGLDSYFEFTGVESGKEYTLRVWEEATNNILANTWTWNNWGGASSVDALAINYMTIQSNILSLFPWVMPVENSAYTPYFSRVANVNSDANITSLDALLLMNRIVGAEGSSPFPGQTNNFRLATTKLEAYEEMAYPNAPELLLGAVGNYAANALSPQYYHEIEIVNLSDGLNVYNIYFVATGDMNASYLSAAEAKSSESLIYNNIIAAEVGDEILIPALINQNAEVNAITLGFEYNNQILQVTDVVGYDIYNIDHEAGTVRIAWMNQIGKVFGQGQEVVVLKAKILSDIHTGTRFAELSNATEFGGANAGVLQGISLSTNYIETGATGVDELSTLNHSIFPNPFNDYTNIHYTLPNAGKVQIVVFNHLGQEVIRILDETQTAGSHQIRLNNYELNGAGTYFYQIRLENEGRSISARGTLLMMK
jgi:hypothetical protein